MRQRFLILTTKIMAVLALICILFADSNSHMPLIGLCVSLTWFGLLVLANRRDDSGTGKTI
jgi:hypothetical protein